VTSQPLRHIAVVAGASGLVGRELLLRLQRAQLYGRIVALTRRPLDAGAAMVEVPARFDALDETLAPLTPADAAVDAYCCLGTTMRAAGSEAAFRQVDFDYVVAFGRWAAARHVRRFVAVSALGADASSRVFYNRVKGETEIALRRLLGASLIALRPGLLDGVRGEWRPGEGIALAVSRPLRRLIPAALRPVQVADVAQSMIDAALASEPQGVIESAAMHGAAARADAG
jgi:uncharacterized protein YbjT (DUF2867 family)